MSLILRSRLANLRHYATLDEGQSPPLRVSIVGQLEALTCAAANPVPYKHDRITNRHCRLVQSTAALFPLCTAVTDRLHSLTVQQDQLHNHAPSLGLKIPCGLCRGRQPFSNRDTSPSTSDLRKPHINRPVQPPAISFSLRRL